MVENNDWEKVVVAVNKIVPIDLSGRVEWKSRKEVRDKMENLRSMTLQIISLLTKYNTMVKLDGSNMAVGAGEVISLINELNKIFPDANDEALGLAENARKNDYDAVRKKAELISKNIRKFVIDNHEYVKSMSERDSSLGELMKILMKLPSSLDRLARRVQEIKMLDTRKERD